MDIYPPVNLLSQLSPLNEFYEVVVRVLRVYKTTGVLALGRKNANERSSEAAKTHQCLSCT